MCIQTYGLRENVNDRTISLFSTIPPTLGKSSSFTYSYLSRYLWVIFEIMTGSVWNLSKSHLLHDLFSQDETRTMPLVQQFLSGRNFIFCANIQNDRPSRIRHSNSYFAGTVIDSSTGYEKKATMSFHIISYFAQVPFCPPASMRERVSESIHDLDGDDSHNL